MGAFSFWLPAVRKDRQPAALVRMRLESLGPGLEPLALSLELYSGSAAVGILKTLSPKRAIDSAGGSLPRRELSTGLRDGDGCAAGESAFLAASS